MIEVLKDYLVSLGFSVDTSSLNSVRTAMGSADDSVAQFSNSSIKNFAKAGVGVLTFVAVANIAIAKFVGGLAQASLENEMFARRMWMNADAARAYTSALDALGVSLQDLYLSPELMNKYLELNSLAKEMAVPDYNAQMRGVREITFEFQKLKLEGTMALQWIGFYLIKILNGPLGGVKKTLSEANEMIQENLPKWSEKAALVVSWFVRMGLAAWKIRYALGAVVGAFAAFKMIGLLTSPLGMLILGLTTLLLLIDDFSTYQDKGDSMFPKLWKWVEDLGVKMDENGFNLENFKAKIDEVKESTKGITGAFSELLKLLKPEGGFGEFLKSGIIATLMVLEDTLTSIIGILKMIDGIATADYGKVGEGWSKFLDGLPKGLFDAAKGLFGGENDDKKESPISYPYQAGKPPKAGYLYPKSSSMVQVKLSPVYHIYGATNPQGVATQVNRNNTSMITRAVQGVNR